MTARCALYMGALKIFGFPWLRPRLLFPKFLTGNAYHKEFAANIPYIIGCLCSKFGDNWFIFKEVTTKRSMDPSSRTRDWPLSVLNLRRLCQMLPFLSPSQQLQSTEHCPMSMFVLCLAIARVLFGDKIYHPTENSSGLAAGFWLCHRWINDRYSTVHERTPSGTSL